ncbi:MAG: FAD-binding protein, partial [Luteibaculum sp.]
KIPGAKYARILRKSLDARKRPALYRLRVESDSKELTPILFPPQYKNVHSAKKQIFIVGFGPAGMFAALKCL